MQLHLVGRHATVSVHPLVDGSPTHTVPPTSSPSPLRADARRNRERIIAAATELFVEQGVDVPLDAIARRAGVGIGTLYRRFPDRGALAHAVALHTYATMRTVAEEACHDARPLRAVLGRLGELRVAVMMSSLAPMLHAMESDALDAAFDGVIEAVRDLATRAKELGELRDDVTADDLLLLGALITRPLEGVPAPHLDAVFPRLLHLVLEGLQPRAEATPAPVGPPPLDPPG